MASSVDPYTSPVDAISQMTSTSNYHSGQNPNDGSATSALLSSHMDCDKLERSNQRMSLIYRILVVVCIVVVFAYVFTIIYLVLSLSRMDSDQSSGSWRSRGSAGRQKQGSGMGASSSSDGEQYCVHENEIEEFKSIWDPEDQKSVMDLRKVIGGGSTLDYKTEQLCFTSLHMKSSTLMESMQGSASYLQGVFRLLTDDQLALKASVNWLDGQQMSYFGTYLIRP
ncbi:hypothetical protein ACOMHN_014677 [Nucella lapillus]